MRHDGGPSGGRLPGVLTGRWPLETHHIGKARAAAAVLEPRAGRRWFERGEDGSETPWGAVVRVEPPRRVMLAWDISADWKCDPTLRTEVEARFVAEGPRSTRVELEHRHLDRFGARADEMRAVFDSPGGWDGPARSLRARGPGGVWR
jgi:uncharacterized protein YndB with AHSA1/START domain